VFFETNTDLTGAGSQGAHVAQARKTLKATQEIPAAILEPPEGTEWIWALFLALSRTRTHSDGDYHPIQYREIDSWVNLHFVSLSHFEIQAIQELDQVWLTWIRKQRDQSNGRSSGTRPRHK
jgi:hypothetical protein